MDAGADEAIVENGGDVFAVAPREVVLAVHAGAGSALGDQLALAVPAERMPLAVCSSSSVLGHSRSFGACDLATVVSSSAALADAAATRACNEVKSVADIEPTLELIAAIPGVDGVLLLKAGHVGMKGELPALVRNRDPQTVNKITRSEQGQACPAPE